MFYLRGNKWCQYFSLDALFTTIFYVVMLICTSGPFMEPVHENNAILMYLEVILKKKSIQVFRSIQLKSRIDVLSLSQMPFGKEKHQRQEHHDKHLVYHKYSVELKYSISRMPI